MPAPETLIHLQSWMSGYLRNPNSCPSAEYIRPSAALSAEKRFNIYHTQVWLRFFHLLQKEYPGLSRLFGAADFNETIAKPYINAYFPTHPSLSLLGAHLPKFLSSCYDEPDRNLVIPIAEIDAAYHRLKTTGAPTLFEHYGDLISFRQELLKQPIEAWETLDFPPINWSQSPTYFLLAAQNERPHIESLPRTAYLILSRLHSGMPLTDALSALTLEEAQEAEPLIFSWFERWSSSGWLPLN